MKRGEVTEFATWLMCLQIGVTASAVTRRYRSKTDADTGVLEFEICEKASCSKAKLVQQTSQTAANRH